PQNTVFSRGIRASVVPPTQLVSPAMSAPPAGRPIRVLRVIARLNGRGPALHVTYLARGLADRGYETTLVAGDVGRGEESMGVVAVRGGVEGVFLQGAR